MRRYVPAISLAGVFAIGAFGLVPPATAAPDDSLVFKMVRSGGAAACLPNSARARVSISDLGPVQNMHVEVFELSPNTEFTVFLITTPAAPFAPAWYQGDIVTNEKGQGMMDVTGIFSDETLILNPGTPLVPARPLHLGVWFADPADAVTAGCPGTVTPFDGDLNAGIQVLNTSNFPNAAGPLLGIR